MSYQVFRTALGTALVAALLGFSGAAGQDRDRTDRGPGTRADTARDNSFQGKIARVEADKRLIVFSDFRRSLLAAPGSGAKATPGTAAGDRGDRGTGDRGTGDKGTGDKGTGDKGTRPGDRGTTTPGDRGTGDRATTTGTGDRRTTGTTGLVTVAVARDAVIMLDGRKADLADLRTGYTVQMTSTGSPGATGSGIGESADKRAPGDGRMMTVTRIEAYTKPPAGTDRTGGKRPGDATGKGIDPGRDRLGDKGGDDRSRPAPGLDKP